MSNIAGWRSFELDIVGSAEACSNCLGTPAMPLGVADHVWTIGELLDAALATPQRRLLACA